MQSADADGVCLKELKILSPIQRREVRVGVQATDDRVVAGDILSPGLRNPLLFFFRQRQELADLRIVDIDRTQFL